MKPFSAGYYIKNNKGRAAIIIFMMFLTTCMLIAGNYVNSLFWYYGKADDYDERVVTVGALTTDTDYADWKSFTDELLKDEKLIVMGRTGRGFPGPSFKTTMGFEMSGPSYVFNSASDMQRVFDLLGIDFNCSGLPDMSLVISKNLAANQGAKEGDLSEDKEFVIRGIVDDGSYINYFLYEEPEGALLGRANIISETLSGDELYKHIKDICGDRKVKVEGRYVDNADAILQPARLLFYFAILLISVIMAITLNSVVTGQYIRREYEFAVYRALGVSKGRIRRKIASEMLVMDVIAIVIGIAGQSLVTFLLNELLYKPKGQYLEYFSKLGLNAVVIANLLVLVPIVIGKGRKMCRMDVTSF